MKKSKTVYVDDKKFDEIENAFKKLHNQAVENEKKQDDYYICFTNEQLKNIFGLTDKEINEMTKNKESGTLVIDDKKSSWQFYFIFVNSNHERKTKMLRFGSRFFYLSKWTFRFSIQT